jgi:hypothetical protein
LARKYECLEKQFEHYRKTKEDELVRLKLELERTKDNLFDMTQIKLDKLLKSQQMFHEQVRRHLLANDDLMSESTIDDDDDDDLPLVTNKKRKHTIGFS